MDRGLLLDDATLRMLRIRFGMLADHIDTFDDRAILFSDHLKYPAGLSLVVAGIHIYGVTFFDMKLLHDSCF